jgi:hypothetical protein
MNKYQTINTDCKRTIVVGDIHGCYEELMALLEEVQFCDSDVLVTVGDFMDRGPQSWDIARFFRETSNAYSVIGNHERRIAGTVRGTSRPSWSQLHSLSQITEDEHVVWVSYFDSLPAVIETKHAVVTHARLDPERDMKDQDPYYTCSVGGDKIKIIVDENGVPAWFHEWKRKYGVAKPICMGHKRFERAELVPGELYALDTNVVRGDTLSAVIFPDGDIVKVRSSANYYEKSLQEWKGIEPAVDTLKLHKILKVLLKEEKNEYERQAVEDFEESLSGMNIPERVGALKHWFIAEFGKVPPAGPKRGEYFINIRQSLPNMYSRLVGIVLSPKPFSIDRFLSYFEGSTLGDINDLLSSLEEWLKVHD